MRRSLPPVPQDTTHSSSKDAPLNTYPDKPKQEGALRFVYAQHKHPDPSDPNKVSKTAVKNIHDFERYTAGQSRHARPLSVTSNPVMEPNYTPNMNSAVDMMAEAQLVLQLQQQENVSRSKNSTYMNWPIQNGGVAPPGHKHTTGSEEYVYENYLIAQKEYEERQKRALQQRAYANLPYQSNHAQPSLPAVSNRAIQRQQAVEQPWNPDLGL